MLPTVILTSLLAIISVDARFRKQTPKGLTKPSYQLKQATRQGIVARHQGGRPHKRQTSAAPGICSTPSTGLVPYRVKENYVFYTDNALEPEYSSPSFLDCINDCGANADCVAVTFEKNTPGSDGFCYLLSEIRSDEGFENEGYNAAAKNSECEVGESPCCTIYRGE